jgi:hypothetical protein
MREFREARRRWRAEEQQIWLRMCAEMDAEFVSQIKKLEFELSNPFEEFRTAKKRIFEEMEVEERTTWRWWRTLRTH